MTLPRWDSLSKKERFQRVIYASVATFFAVMLVYQLFSGGSGSRNDQDQRPMVLTGSRASTDRGFAGCRHVEDIDQFTALMAAGDTTAALAFVERSDCKLMPAGTQGSVDDRNVWHNAICIRQDGEPLCSWIPTTIAKQAE